ncbi:STAS domain-containing protein [Streptomyces sp. NPDC048419]|uniref:STAS domain-containing protein n=1 Tax=Streptomyces sp. NPDC048419 TaxID=3365547 RepID=UPI003720E08D
MVVGQASIEVTGSGTCLVARVSGEMDYTTRPALQDRFTELVARAPFIVLDLSGVTFCDSAGLTVLLVARLRATKHAVELVVACVPPHLRTLLQMTGADQVLRVFATVADAEAAEPRA